ncbi:MAG: hypothetical protein M9949_10845 [Candidatus Kapabacteria bacterium]|nr:hypothetical protein [Candidatus Kapabacteria bacterium]
MKKFSFIVLFLLCNSFAFSQPTTITYQGKLLDNSDKPVNESAVAFTFAIYDAETGGNKIWPPSNAAATKSIDIVNGLYSVILGTASGNDEVIEPSIFNGITPYLEVGVKSTTLPRTSITSVPFSILSNNLTASAWATPMAIGSATPNSGAFTALTVGTTNTYAFPSEDGTDGQVLVTDGTGDLSWETPSGITGSGTTNYMTKWTTGGSVIGNSLFQDNGTSASINTSIASGYQLYVYRQQLTANGDGQHTLMGYRNRDSKNDGTGYSQDASNTGSAGHSFWGDLYTFGVGGWNYNDYSRCGGVLGADVSGTYWGSLGYRSSGSINYGVYGTSAYASGTGFLSNNEVMGIGAGFFGGIIGSWSRGMIMGNVNSGELFASYNVGNEYTSGYSADLVKPNTGQTRVPAYSMTSTELSIHTYGVSQIEQQPVYVAFPTTFSSILGDVPVATVTPIGAPASLYIASIDQNGFWVALAPSSIAEGISNVRFSWIAVGKRIDANQIAEVPAEITNINFDSNMNNVLFDENNKEQSGGSIWWDGNKVRFDTAPTIPAAPKVEPMQEQTK